MWFEEVFYACLCVHSLSVTVVFELFMACIYCINVRVCCILHLVQTLQCLLCAVHCELAW